MPGEAFEGGSRWNWEKAEDIRDWGSQARLGEAHVGTRGQIKSLRQRGRGNELRWHNSNIFAKYYKL